MSERILYSRAVAFVPSVATLVVSVATAFAAAGEDKDSWESLPEVKYEQRLIGGQAWTEGLSKLAVGRFAVNSVNGLMNETVADFSFYKSHYDMFSYGGYPRDYFDFHVPGTDGLPETDEITGDWAHQIRTRVYEGGHMVRLITGALAPGFLVETNSPRFTLTKRDTEKDRVDWRGTIPEHERRGVFPLFVLVPREGGKVELVTRERGGWNIPIDLGKPDQPWVVAVYPPVSREFLWNFRASDGKFVDEKFLWNFPNYLKDDTVAVLLTFREGLGLRTQFGELTLYSLDRKEIGMVGLSTAFDGLLKGVQSGLAEVKPHPGDVLIAESMAERWQNDKWNFAPIVQRATVLARLLHTYPLSVREWFRIEEERGEVKIRNEFTFHRWGNADWQSDDYAPVPMAFALSHKNLGWPEFIGITDPGIRGRLGPFLYFSKRNWCEWSIPHCHPEYALQPDMPAPEKAKLIQEIKQFASNDQYKIGWRPGDVYARHLEPGSKGYQELKELSSTYRPYTAGLLPWGQPYTQALSVWSMLDDTTREAVLKKMSIVLRYSFYTKEYFRKQEPISGHKYANSAPGVEKPEYMAGDVPSFMAGPLYYGYLYAKFSGDWKWLKPYYREAWDISRFAEIYADWSWPGVSLREHVFVSHFDPMICGVLALIGLERMSDVFGTTEEQGRAQYLLSRTAVTLVLQSLLPRWVDPDNLNPALTCDGASEHGPMLLDFERVTGNLRRQRSYFAYSWLGRQPELFRYRSDIAGPGFWKNFQEQFVNSDKWNWMEDFAALSHAAMRGWLRDWPREDIENFLSSEKIYSGRGGNLSLLPSADVLMLLWARKNEVPAFLVNWERGTVERFSWEEESGHLVLKVNFPEKGQITFRSWRALPDETRVNGTIVTQFQLAEGIPVGRNEPSGEMGPLFTIAVPAGQSEITLIWNRRKQISKQNP